MMWRGVIVCGLLLLLAGCGKHKAFCFEQGENAHVTADLGYFYDSAAWAMHGPSKLEIIPDDFQTNPCKGMAPLSP